MNTTTAKPVDNKEQYEVKPSWRWVRFNSREYNPPSIANSQSLGWSRNIQVDQRIPISINAFIFPPTESYHEPDESSPHLPALFFNIHSILRSALFWDITQREVVNHFRRLGITSVLKHRQGIAALRCITSQKNVDLLYFAAEAWNHFNIVSHLLLGLSKCVFTEKVVVMATLYICFR